MLRRLVVLTLLAPLGLVLTAAAQAHDPARPDVDHVDTIDQLRGVDLARAVAAAQDAAADGPSLAASDPGLPTTWCGTARTTDNTVNASVAPELPQFKVVYLHAADRPNRFAAWADLIQANVSLIEQFVSSQPGSTKAPRFDMGTDCGPEYVDIQTVSLPSGRAAYAGNFGAAVSAVSPRVNFTAGRRNVLMVGDGFGGGGASGIAQLFVGGDNSRPDAGNRHNNGSLFAEIFTPDTVAPAATANGWAPTVFLHELTHNMGGVQWNAPHTTQRPGANDGRYSHAWDGYDVMAYSDGPNMAHPYITTACGPISGAAMWQTYDCGNDDYFNAAPVAGSYLATNWSVYSSVFMAECDTLPAGSCLQGVPAEEPSSTVAPAISGTARRTETLTATRGSWSPAGVGFTYAWQRSDDNGGWTSIAGATARTHVLAAADVGRRVGVQVTASNGFGSTTAVSQPSDVIASLVPVNVAPPALTGVARRGRELSGTTGSWSPIGSYVVQWQREGATDVWADLPGATTNRLALSSADVGHRVRLKVRATNADGVATAFSAPTDAVAVDPPVSTLAPALAGTAARAQTLSTTTGTWLPGGTMAIQWLREEGDDVWTPITGATSARLTLGTADIGHRIRARVTATNVDGTAVALSAPSSAVATAPPVPGTPPSITGTAQRLQGLLAFRGTWVNPGGTLAIQWQRSADGSEWTDIPGATLDRHALTGADVGQLVRLQVTATNPDATVVRTSAPTAVVRPAPPVATAGRPPVISGTVRLASRLTATAGSWTPAGPALAFQWQRVTGSEISDIDGATQAAYTTTEDDVGTRLRVRVTATNQDGSAAAPSAQTIVVERPPAVDTAPAAPSGTLLDTHLLTADPGTWTPSTAPRAFAWLRCPASAATAASGCVEVGRLSTYRLVDRDVGSRLAVRVTATTPGGTASVLSPVTGVVEGRPLISTVAPVISGTAMVTETLRSSSGGWSVPLRTLSFQWQRCTPGDESSCTAVTGATGAAYAATVADREKELRVRLVATSPGRTTTVTTAPVLVAAQPMPAASAAPSVLGTAARLQTLRVTSGTWTGKPTRMAYRWLRCDADGEACQELTGVTAMTYPLGLADVGHRLQVRVEATNTTGTTVVTTTPSGVVAAVPPVLGRAVAVGGQVQQGGLASATGALWTTTRDTVFSYRWQRCEADGTGCADLPGATSGTLRLTADDTDRTLKVTMTATNPDGAVSTTSPASAVVLPPAPTLATRPTLTGTTTVGQTLSATAGSYGGRVDSTVLQLQRCASTCTPVVLAGDGTYVLVSTDRGKRMRLAETVRGPGGTLVATAVAMLGPVA